MKTDDLIAQLGSDVPRIGRYVVVQRLLLALVLGAVISFLVLLATIGVRPDINAAAQTAPFWVKWIFTLTVGSASFVVLRRLARPDGSVGWLWAGIALPFAVVLMMSVGELLATNPEQWSSLAMGRTPLLCSAAILGLSVPSYLGVLWAFRAFAPTRLRVAGAVGGLAAAAMGATVYAFACPESSATFMISWYTLGMTLPVLLGILTARLNFRW